MDILEYIGTNTLVTDGAFGTYYTAKYGDQSVAAPEFANITRPERVLEIHSEYVKSGAKLIRTNTFAANTASMDTDIEEVITNIKAAVRLAKAAAGAGVYVAGDIGPVPLDSGFTAEQVCQQYIRIGETLQDMGVDVIWFETFPSFEVVSSVIKHLKERRNTPVMVSFCVNQFGYSNAGFSARALLAAASKDSCVDMLGLNCGVGPYHMLRLVRQLDLRLGKPVAVMPNAGYPKFTQSRLVFNDNKEGFVSKIRDIAGTGVDIIGGCCGTNPDYVRMIAELVSGGIIKKMPKLYVDSVRKDPVKKDNFMKAKMDDPSHKLIAVELAPPVDSNDQKVLDAAHILKQSHVDVVTFPDSPSGRTRADSILMAEKIQRETGLKVMPHLCCRDKNAIAIRGSVLGAQLNGIKDFLVITGDPVPVMFRQTTRSVFNFDSIGMMNLLKTMNDEVLSGDKITYGGAINQNRQNIHIEIDRIRRKMEAGAEFFMTQPVFSEKQAGIIRKIKSETGAVILVGIMPLVSRRNALFMKNEMAGIEIPDDIIEMYDENATRQQGEDTGVLMARNIMSYTKDFADGYYFSFPFNRVHMLSGIVD